MPLALLLLAFLEMQQFHPYLLHGLGVMLVAGRLTHALGLSRDPEDFRLRVAGTGASFAVLITAASLLLVAAFDPA